MISLLIILYQQVKKVFPIAGFHCLSYISIFLPVRNLTQSTHSEQLNFFKKEVSVQTYITGLNLSRVLSMDSATINVALSFIFMFSNTKQAKAPFMFM